MTAPLFNLSLPSSVVGAAPAGGGGGAPASPVEGFDALLAALFGGTAEPAAAGIFGEAKPTGEENGQDAQAGETQTLTPNADAQALAAMLAAMPAAAAATPPEAEAAEGTAPTPAPILNQEAVFAPIPPAAVATPAAAAAAQGQDASALETALAALSDAETDTPETVVAALTTPDKPTTDQKAAQPAPTAAAPVQPAAVAPPARPQGQAHAAPAQQTAPAPDAAAQSMVQAEAMAEEAAPVAETPKERPSARTAKLGENARRGATPAAAAPPAPDANDPLVQGALAQATAADNAGEPASAIETGPVAPADADADGATADAPDAQPLAPASPAPLSAAGPEAAPVRATHETVANLAAQVVKKLDGHSTKFDVQLNPLGLGEVNVAVEIGANGKMTAAMSFETTHAAAELRGRSHELQRALEQAGFDVSGGLTFDVASERGSGRGFAEQQQQQHDGAAWRGRAFQALLDTAGGGSDQAMANALYLQRRTTSGVDIRI